MSQENVELLRKAYEAFARGDVEAVMERSGFLEKVETL